MVRGVSSHALRSSLERRADLEDTADVFAGVDAGCSGSCFGLGEAFGCCGSFCLCLRADSGFVGSFCFGVHECLGGDGEFVYGVSGVARGLVACKAPGAACHPPIGLFGELEGQHVDCSACLGVPAGFLSLFGGFCVRSPCSVPEWLVVRFEPCCAEEEGSAGFRVAVALFLGFLLREVTQWALLNGRDLGVADDLALRRLVADDDRQSRTDPERVGHDVMRRLSTGCEGFCLLSLEDHALPSLTYALWISTTAAASS
jgi:hypothetical protein